MIGNRLETDVLGANSVGIKTVLLRWSNKYRGQPKERRERPNLIVKSLRQIPATGESLGLDTSYEGADLMLSLLRNVKGRGILSDEIERIVEDESYQLMVRHHGLTKGRMKKVLESLTYGILPQKPVENLVFRSLMRDLDRPGKIENFLNKTKKNWDSIAYDSTKAALKYLPAGTGIWAKVHFILSGHSDAYTVGKENIVLNISMFLGNSTYLEMVLAHELRHRGLSSVEVPRAKPKTLGEEKLNLLIGGTKGEGLATYVMYQVTKTRRVELWSRTYQEGMRNINEHFQRIETELLEISQQEGYSSKEEIYEKFFSCMGIAYFVGCKMARVIEETLGRNALIDCMAKPAEEFFLLYNVAAKKKKGYVFREKTTETLRNYSHDSGQ